MADPYVSSFAKPEFAECKLHQFKISCYLLMMLSFPFHLWSWDMLAQKGTGCHE